MQVDGLLSEQELLRMKRTPEGVQFNRLVILLLYITNYRVTASRTTNTNQHNSHVALTALCHC